MKKLYSKGAVHPSPPPPPPPFSDLLDFLPAAILVLTAALTADDREVLAYLLLSCSAASSPPAFPATGVKQQSPTRKGLKVAGGCGRDHPPAFGCNCFGCYMSFWVRWDSSPNRQLIHEIIDAFEDWVLAKNTNKGGRREKRKKGSNGRDSPKIDRVSDVGFSRGELGSPESAEHGGDDGGHADGSGGGEMEERGSVKKLVSFIGERIWGVWG